MTQLQRILIGILLVQVVATIFVFRPDNNAPTTGPLFPDIVPADITSLTITDPDGQTLTLARTADGWVLPNAGDFPATATKVNPLIQKIIDIPTNRLITENSSSHRRLKVADDDYQMKVEFTTADEEYTLYLGTLANFRAAHVRRAGQDVTYQAPNLNSSEFAPNPTNWLDPSYAQVNQADLTTVTLTNPNGTFLFEKDDTGQWLLSGLNVNELFDEAALNLILNRLTNLRFQQPLGRQPQTDYGLTPPQATLTLNTTDGQTYTLDIGNSRNDGNTYIIKWSESPYYVTVPSTTVQDLLTQTRDDFYQTPTPPATPSILIP
ncbi:MAG TPA: DUF4340 domain-containing protein [Anaerolineae bacterium]|nr:DUF4340 domain-containing protein [Anaerolineae bacterium]